MYIYIYVYIYIYIICREREADRETFRETERQRQRHMHHSLCYVCLRFVGDLCGSLLTAGEVSLYLRSLTRAVSFKTTERGNKTFIKIRKVEQHPLPWFHAAAAETPDPAAAAAAAAAANSQSLALRVASYICAHVYE